MIGLVIGVPLLVAGTFFLAVSALGVVRLPDFFTRAHAMGKSETLGGILVLAGLAALEGLSLTSFKLLLILVFTAIANPVATHALVRAALRSGMTPWVPEERAPETVEETRLSER